MGEHMRCPDIVLSALSYHPRHRRGAIARAYWDFVASWQDARGGLHRRGGQWYLLELASRFPFSSVRQILAKALPLAVRLQRADGGFQADCPGASACEVALAYARHGLLSGLLAELHRDPLPLIRSQDTPLGVKTRREALRAPREDDRGLAERLRSMTAGRQRADGSWGGLIVATVEAVHGLLDCGAAADGRVLRRACDWLLAQQRPPEPGRFANVPPLDLPGMFWTDRDQDEVAFGRARHPAWRWKAGQSCLALLPIFQTGAALGALCRYGLSDAPAVRQGFRDLLRLRGPGGRNYTQHWCACAAARWVRTRKPRFAE